MIEFQTLLILIMAGALMFASYRLNVFDYFLYISGILLILFTMVAGFLGFYTLFFVGLFSSCVIVVVLLVYRKIKEH